MWSWDDPANKPRIKWDWFTGGRGGKELNPLAALGGGGGLPGFSNSSKATGGLAGDSKSGDFFGEVHYQSTNWADVAKTAIPFVIIGGVIWLISRK